MKIFDNSEENEKYYEKLLEFVEAHKLIPYPPVVKDLIKQIAIKALLYDKAEITGYCISRDYIELTWRCNND